MLLTDVMISSVERSFNVAYHGIDPGEFFMLNTVRATTCYNRYMLAACFRHATKTVQTVRYHRTGGLQMLGSPTFNFSFTKSLQFGVSLNWI